MKKPYPASWPTRGFTLIEVVMGVALMAMILVSAYLCLSAGFASQKIIEPRSEALQNARVALALITADLRVACSLTSQTDFIGVSHQTDEFEADTMDFGTHNFTPRHPREGDFCQESILLEKNPRTSQYSLWRRRFPYLTKKETLGGNLEEIATGVKGLKLEYYDGIDWVPSWGDPKAVGQSMLAPGARSSSSGFPVAVRITLYMESGSEPTTPTPLAKSTPTIPPMVFQTVARLNLADAAEGSAEGADASSSSGSEAPSHPGANN